MAKSAAVGVRRLGIVASAAILIASGWYFYPLFQESLMAKERSNRALMELRGDVSTQLIAQVDDLGFVTVDQLCVGIDVTSIDCRDRAARMRRYIFESDAFAMAGRRIAIHTGGILGALLICWILGYWIFRGFAKGSEPSGKSKDQT